MVVPIPDRSCRQLERNYCIDWFYERGSADFHNGEDKNLTARTSILERKAESRLSNDLQCNSFSDLHMNPFFGDCYGSHLSCGVSRKLHNAPNTRHFGNRASPSGDVPVSWLEQSLPAIACMVREMSRQWRLGTSTLSAITGTASQYHFASRWDGKPIRMMNNIVSMRGSTSLDAS